MLNAILDHVTTLDEFYSEIRKQHIEAHGEHYCAQHDAMVNLMVECDSYKELGTHQGASAAAACLTNPKSVELIDISFEKWDPFKTIFEDYCTANNIKFSVKQISSADPKSASMVDLLLIDSNHQPTHLQKELDLHTKFVRKYIVLHDTSVLFGKPDERLYHVVKNYCETGINPWHIIDRCTDNVGYTVIANSLNI